MKLLPRTPLLVLGALGLLSAAVALIAATPTSPSGKKSGPDRYLAYCKSMSPSEWQNFKKNLPQDKSTFHFEYNGGDPQGNLKELCECNCGNKHNINVTQQASFQISSELTKFLKRSFKKD